VPEASVPDAQMLLSLYPNPFNPSTTVRLYLPGSASDRSQVEVGVYDVQGRLLRTLHKGPVASGWQSWVWDGRDTTGRVQASGLYFLRARSGAQTAVHKMSLIK
jgi:flagellar hook assembly protein FlgD